MKPPFVGRDDDAVSPVIATILMVAVTVAVAAVVFVWVSGFGTDTEATESNQLRINTYDSDNDAAVDWLRLLLVRGETGPFAPSVVEVTLVEPGGAVTQDHDGASTHVVCTSLTVDSGACDSDAEFFDGDGDDWAQGGVLYVPCQAAGNHQLTVTIRGDVVHDRSVRCDEVA